MPDFSTKDTANELFTNMLLLELQKLSDVVAVIELIALNHQHFIEEKLREGSSAESFLGQAF